ncbi:MAG: hypothetical protein R3B06_23870 [Kofleriaceae bacterium]
MEGIVDGAICDDCFVCGVLWPGLAACPRCGGRARWQPARMDHAAVDGGDVSDLAARWHRRGDLAALTALLEALHADPADADPAASGLDFDRLRAAWRRLCPAQAPPGPTGDD